MSSPLESEASRTVRNRKVTGLLQIYGAVFSLATFFWMGHHEARLVASSLGGALGSVVSYMSARRWRVRAAWYANTPQWHQQLEGMPDVRVFPRLCDWALARREDRKFLRRVAWAGVGVNVVLLLGIGAIAIRAIQ